MTMGIVLKRVVSQEKIDKIVQENPDLTYEFIKNILIARQEIKAENIEPYTFDNPFLLHVNSYEKQKTS